MNALLAGLNVVEIGDYGELCGKLLALAGASVTKVEPPGGCLSRRTGPFVDDTPGEDRSLKHYYLNGDKTCISLDLASNEGQDAFRSLVKAADIVLDAGTVDYLSGFGLGYDAIAEERTVWCSITPFGLTGPWRDRPYNDLTSMAVGGIVMMCGYDDHDLPPVRPDGEHGLAIAGAYAMSGILAALWYRLESGYGQLIDLSIHEAIAGTTEGAFMNWEYLERNPSRKTGRHTGTAESWQLQSGDGDWMVLFGGGVPRDRKALLGLLAWMDEYGAAANLHDPAFESLIYTPPQQGGELRAEFARTVAGFINTRPTDEVYRRGQAIGMPWAPVRRPEENLFDPHWEDRQFWREAVVPGTETPVRFPGSPYRFADD